MPDAKITPEVRDVIERSTTTVDGRLLLPEQLDRKLYDAVNRALENAGAKWNRSAKAHILAPDTMAKLGAGLESGIVRDEKKAKQQFDTPLELARTIIALAGIEEGMNVLEPSAGLGMLALEARDAGGIVDCVEIDQGRYEALTRLVGINRVHHGDFLATGPFTNAYHRVVMNPPFTKGQDIKHVAHALKFLKPGGRLVSVISPMTEQKRGMQELLTGRNFETRPVAAGTFKKAGTLIATDLITIYAR